MSSTDRYVNAGAAFAAVVVDELTRHGVTDAVIAPGSRSTPLALALLSDPRVRLHVRIDERSAGFLALGIARTSERPVPVLCTSGTATAHLHAAALEADQSRVPLLLFTADRPPELRGVGANQTVDQVGLYGSAVRWSCDVGVPESRPESVAYWRSVVSRAVAVAAGRSSGPAGPVHVNLPLREPLTATDDGVGFPYPVDGRPGGAPWTDASRGSSQPPTALADQIGSAGRGVLVAGDGLGRSDAAAVASLAARAGWPLIAEPHSNARSGSQALRGTDALLRDPDFVRGHRPDLVVVAGRVGLSRTLLAWLAATPHVIVDRDGMWWDPTRSAVSVVRADVSALARLPATTADAGWLESWLEPAKAAGAAIDAVLDETDALTEPRVARDVAASLPEGASLVVASSMPIRDLDLTMQPRSDLRIVANRGVSGIDGFVSTASGVALANSGPTWALAGDLSVLHDVNGLLVGPGEVRPDLTVVVVNNDGGGIFSLLPQASGDAAAFERLFGTPHGVDLQQLATAYAVDHRLVRTSADLDDELARTPAGLRLVEVRTDRAANAELHRRLGEAAAATLR